MLLELMTRESRAEEFEAVGSLRLGEFGPCFGLLISGRSGSVESSNLLPLKSVSGSSCVTSWARPANSGCPVILGSSLYEPKISNRCTGDTGERGLSVLPVVLVKELTRDHTIDPRIGFALDFLCPFA